LVNLFGLFFFHEPDEEDDEKDKNSGSKEKSQNL
jgi:hypothetical protein